ncbi:hypothetical protein BWI92_25065 [Flectobacillus sp. BAB-3569]|nr:hypothetical protein BWI92_25065 [Flectobacillus sp. BAB-3569]
MKFFRHTLTYFRVCLLIITICSCSRNLRASHIFGGNMSIEVIDKLQSQYKITLNIYVDMYTLLPVELDNMQNLAQQVRFFSKKDNKRVQDAYLSFEKMTDLVYDNYSCAQLRRLATREFTYSKIVVLTSNQFSDTQGYYLSWARCCRNADIDNIKNANNTGLTMYVEFPSLKDYPDYSSPKFKIPNGDYICILKPFKLQMAVEKKMQDTEIRYSIVTPYGSHNDLLNYDNPPKPGPYPSVLWGEGFSESNSIKGSPALSVHPQTGVLSVKANQTGLFTFTIQCEQFKSGKLIGLVRQDFQLPVVDCRVNTPPEGKILYKGQVTDEVGLCPNESILLTVSDAGGSYNFQWQKNGENLLGENTPRINVKDFGDYTVIKSYQALCANDTISQIVKVKPLILTEFLPLPKEFCKGETTTIEVIPLRTNVDLSWSKNGKYITNGTRIRITEPGIYKIYADATKIEGCYSEDSIEISLKKEPIIKVNPTRASIYKGQSILISVESSESNTLFSWSPNKWISNINSQNPEFTPQQSTTYTCVAETEGMCPVKSEIDISVIQSLLIPSAFTPNQDGHNDIWYIVGTEQFEEIEVSIFNRWGNLIFYSRGYKDPWDGKFNGEDLPSDTYTYQIKKGSLDENYVYSGTVNLFR